VADNTGCFAVPSTFDPIWRAGLQCVIEQ